MRLHIEPPPSPDECAAIEAALRQLFARQARGVRALRYRDVVGIESLRSLQPRTWADAARLESLACGV